LIRKLIQLHTKLKAQIYPYRTSELKTTKFTTMLLRLGLCPRPRSEI